MYSLTFDCMNRYDKMLAYLRIADFMITRRLRKLSDISGMLEHICIIYEQKVVSGIIYNLTTMYIVFARQII